MDQPTTYPREHKSPSTRDTPLLCRFQDILSLSFFFFNDPPPTEISPLPLHDALPILANAPHRPLPHPLPARVSRCGPVGGPRGGAVVRAARGGAAPAARPRGFDAGRRHRCGRSEEHTSELQSRLHLVCRLPLEQKRTAPAAAPAASITPAYPIGEHFYLNTTRTQCGIPLLSNSVVSVFCARQDMITLNLRPDYC